VFLTEGVSTRQEGALAAAAALGSVGRLAGHAAGLGMLAGGTTRSINAFSTWSISVLPPLIATEHICPVLRSTINPFPPVYTHAHRGKTAKHNV